MKRGTHTGQDAATLWERTRVNPATGRLEIRKPGSQIPGAGRIVVQHLAVLFLGVFAWTFGLFGLVAMFGPLGQDGLRVFGWMYLCVLCGPGGLAYLMMLPRKLQDTREERARPRGRCWQNTVSPTRRIDGD